MASPILAEIDKERAAEPHPDFDQTVLNGQIAPLHFLGQMVHNRNTGCVGVAFAMNYHRVRLETDFIYTSKTIVPISYHPPIQRFREDEIRESDAIKSTSDGVRKIVTLLQEFFGDAANLSTP